MVLWRMSAAIDDYLVVEGLKMFTVNSNSPFIDNKLHRYSPCDRSACTCTSVCFVSLATVSGDLFFFPQQIIKLTTITKQANIEYMTVISVYDSRIDDPKFSSLFTNN